jgi:hypothetical protein
MKFKVIRSEHARSDEVILEGDSLEEIGELALAKSGSSGIDIGFSEEDFDFGTGGDGDDGGGFNLL